MAKTQKGTQTSDFGSKARVNHDSSKFYNSKMYNNLNITALSARPESKLPDEYLNSIIESSCENMKEVPDNSVHLMIASPPYNVSKEYDEYLSLDEYLNLLKNAFSETYRVLVDGGRTCINVANLGRKPYIPLSDYISKIMLDIGFNMRGEIIWNKAASASPSTAWGSWQSATNPILPDVHEYILIFSKGDYKRDAQGKKNSIDKEQFMEFTKSIWTMKTESAKKIGHTAPFPQELPERLIHLYSFIGDIVIDPFMGSGTTATASIKLNRNFVGYEISKDYIDIADKRISNITPEFVLS